MSKGVQINFVGQVEHFPCKVYHFWAFLVLHYWKYYRKLYLVKICPKIAEKNDLSGEEGVTIFFMELNDRRAVRSFQTFGNTSHDNIRVENTFFFWNEDDLSSLTVFVTSLLHHFHVSYYRQKYVKNWQLGPRSWFFFVLLLTTKWAQCGKLVELIWDLKFYELSIKTWHRWLKFGLRP